MLNAMRNSKRFLTIILWLVIIAFVSTIFVVWGIGTNENDNSYVVKINGETITFEEYRNFYDETVESMRQLFGENYDNLKETFNIEDLVLNNLIDRSLLLEEARRLKIPATDYEVIATIKGIPSFQSNGVFDPQLYKDIIRYNRQTISSFESNIRNTILVDKLKNMVQKSAYVVSDAVVMKEYDYRNSIADISYFKIPLIEFYPNNEPTLDNLTSFYNANKEKYRKPASIELKYITFDKNKFKQDDVKVTNEEILSYYNNNITSYTLKESAKTRQIIVNVADWNNLDNLNKAKEKIDKALLELSKGKSFFNVLKKYSDDKDDNGLMGNVERGQLVPEFEEAIFSLKPGEYSNIVKSNYGFHIFMIDNKIPEKVYTLEEKKDEIKSKISKDKLVSSYRNYVLNNYRDILKAGNISAYILANPKVSLNVMKTANFTENETGLPLFLKLPNIKNTIFKLNKGDLSQLVEDGDITYLFEIYNRVNSSIPSLDDTKNKIIKDYNKNYAESLGKKRLEEMLINNTFDNISKVYKAKILVEKGFKRINTNKIFNNNTISQLDINSIISNIFKSKAGNTLEKPLYINNLFYIIKVDGVYKPTIDISPEEKGAITSYIRNIKMEAALKSYIDSLKSKAKIQINPNFSANL